MSAWEIEANEFGAVVVAAFAERQHLLGKVFGEANGKCQGVFGYGNHVGAGGVDDLNSAFGGGLNVDLVIAHAVPADHSKPGRGIHEGGIDGACRANDQGISVVNFAMENVGREGGGHPEFTG